MERINNSKVGADSGAGLFFVEHNFAYGWGDAGWMVNDKPMRFNSVAGAEAEIAEFIRDADENFGVGAYRAEDYRVVPVEK